MPTNNSCAASGLGPGGCSSSSSCWDSAGPGPTSVHSPATPTAGAGTAALATDAPPAGPPVQPPDALPSTGPAELAAAASTTAMSPTPGRPARSTTGTTFPIGLAAVLAVTLARRLLST